MNRTAVFITVCGMIAVAFICATVLAIVKPEGFLTFTGFIGSTVTVIIGFAVTLYGLSKVSEQTNGRLTARDNEIARLNRELIHRGHADAVAAGPIEPSKH